VGSILLAGVIAAGVMAILGVLRQNGRLLLRLEALEEALRARGIAVPEVQGPSEPGLAVGSQAPEFSLDGLTGETLTLASLRARGKPVLLFFTDPGCAPCRALLPRIGGWKRAHAGSLTIAAITRGDAEKMRPEATEHEVEPVLAEGNERAVSDAYEARATPSAVLVDAHGAIASPLASGEVAIAALVERTTAPALQVQQMQPAANPGDPLPKTNGITDLDGNSADLGGALAGEERVLLFWDPGCGFCQRMVPDLQTLEREEPDVAEAFVLVSRGDPQANRGHGLSLPILLEQSFELGPKVGIQGTPSAVRVDADGRVASGVAVGADAVLALARTANDA
jgi:thiol-disulfide isomerase/thioredoxin